MTISTTTARVRLAADGTSTDFSFPYYFESESHLAVYLSDSSGIEVPQVVASDYTVAGAGDAAGGTISFIVAPAAGEYVTILRQAPMTQPTQADDVGTFRQQAFEAQFDRHALQAQSLQEQLDRAVKLKPSSAHAGPVLPDPEAGLVIAWNAAGDELENAVAVADISAAASAAATATQAATEANVSAVSAAASADTAETAETNAQANADLAALSAGNAAASESNATESETAAALSETNSAASASNALTSESNASTSETNALASANAAATSQANAAISEAAAAVSATEAAASADAAAIFDPSSYYTKPEIDASIITAAERSKLAGVEDGAEVNSDGDKATVQGLSPSADDIAMIVQNGQSGAFRFDAFDLSIILSPSSVTTTTVDSGTETCTQVSHGLFTGDVVYPTTSINGLTEETFYYVIRVDADDFQLATSLANALAGSAVNLTGSTNFTLKKHIDPLQAIYVIPSANAIDGSDGAWVRVYDGGVDPRWFGAAANGSSDDRAAIFAAMNYVNAAGQDLYKAVDLGGVTYAIAGPIVRDDDYYLSVMNGGVVAVSGSWTGTDHMFSWTGGRGNGLNRVSLDANALAGCIHTVGSSRNRFVDVDCFHMHANASGVFVEGGSNNEFHLVNVHQWLSEDSERTDQAKRTADGFVIDTADTRLVQCTAAWCDVPLTLADGAHHTRVIGCHFYNGRGSTGTPHTDPINIVVEAGAYKNIVTCCYIDNGYIDLYSTDLVITNNVYLYNSGVATMTSHLRIYASQANDEFDDEFTYANNQHSNSFKVVDLVDNGNSWAVTADLESYNQNVEMTGRARVLIGGDDDDGHVQRLVGSHSNALLQFSTPSTTQVVDFGANGNDLLLRTNGTTRVRVASDGGFNFQNNVVSAARWTRAGLNTGQLIGDAHSFNIISISQGASPQDFTLDNEASTGTTVKFVQRSTQTITLTPDTGGLLNGGTGSATLTRWLLVTATVYRNGDGSSAEWSLEGTWT